MSPSIRSFFPGVTTRVWCKRMATAWHFHILGDGSKRACKVELTLNYGFDNATLGKLVGPVFDKIAASLVDAFVKRAQQVYGD